MPVRKRFLATTALSRSLLRLSWIISLPILAIMFVWATATLERYTELGLRQLGDNRLNGMTLMKAGSLQLRYMQRITKLELKRSMSLLPEDDFPFFHLFVKDAHIRQFDSALPRSGHQYLPAQIIKNDKLIPVKVKYRGDFAIHWGFFKKSWRVKNKKGNLYNNIRTFNLITPKTGFIYSNYIGYKMAGMIGLLTPQAELVKLNLNGRNQGMYLLVEQISESLLRNSNRLPGDIYSGDELYGKDIWNGLDKNLFTSAGLWRKVAINNHYPISHRIPLQSLLAALKGEGKKWDTSIINLLDMESFARLNLLEQLSNSRHMDDSHNWRLYYDPGRGKFSPIVWDILPWTSYWFPTELSELSNWTPPDALITSDLMRRLHGLPEFIKVKNKIFTEFLESDSPDRILGLIKNLNKRMEPVLEKEPSILSDEYEWITPQQSLSLMKANVVIFSKIISHLRSLYPTPAQAAPRHQISGQESGHERALVWQGIINIDQDTLITNPLRILRGTEIRIANGSSLTIHNKLTIDGTAAQPVLFTGVNGQPFGSVIVEGEAASGSRLNGFHMMYGSGYRDDLREFSGMLSIHDVDNISLSHCKLESNETFDDMLHVVYSSIIIEDCEFSNAHMDAIDLDMSDAEILNSTFRISGNDGLDLMGSTVLGSNLLFELNGDKGISVGERSRLTIKDSEFNRNKIGIQIKDDSRMSGVALSFTNNVIALDAYRKNWRYGNGGYAEVCKSQFRNNGKIENSDKHSTILRDTRQCLPLP